jgi:hypothetical protein
MAHRIASIEADPSRLRLVLRWRDGSVTTKDLRAEIERRPLFAALRRPSTFRRVRVLDHGYAIGWAKPAVDFAADALWYEAHRRGLPFENALMTKDDFKRWMRDNDFSLSTAAEVLGLSRRTIAYYASGAKPIPRIVFLACMALSSARRRSRKAA